MTPEQRKYLEDWAAAPRPGPSMAAVRAALAEIDEQSAEIDYLRRVVRDQVEAITDRHLKKACPDPETAAIAEIHNRLTKLERWAGIVAWTPKFSKDT